MITIVGKIANAVDCGCYEIEALPAPEPRKDFEDCACDEPDAGDAGIRARVDAKRSFSIAIPDADAKKWFEGRKPWFSFRVYRDGELELGARDRLPWEPGDRPGGLVIDLCAPKAPQCAKVCGRVTDCRGKPLAGMRIAAFDVDLYDVTEILQDVSAARMLEGKDGESFGERLGETVTNECGEYCVCYRPKSYARREIASADIRVVVGTPAGQPFRTLKFSEIQFNAPAELTVDLAVPGSELDGSSEFSEYHEKLARLGCATAAARRALTDAKLDFISSEAGIPVEHLVLLRSAYLLDKEFFQPLEALPDHFIPQVLYGLLRTGVEGPFPEWARRYLGRIDDDRRVGDKLASRLDQAIAACIINRNFGLAPLNVPTDLVALLVWAISFLFLLTRPLMPNRSSWFELFSLVWSNVLDFIRFGLAWLKFGISEPMWQALAATFTTAEIDRLKTFVQLVEVAGFHAPAVKLFLQDQAAFEAAIGTDALWTAYFRPATVVPPPTGIVFQEYALEVLLRARVYFGVRPLGGWVTGINAGAFPASLNLTNAQARAAALRLSRLATSAGFAATLAASGFTSARDIAALRWEDFLARVGAGVDSVEALHVFTKARETRAVSFAATLQLSPVLNAPVPYLGTPNLAATTLAGSPVNLLGSGSSCDCEGRPTIFSPAAYLHALRRFLANVAGTGGAAGARAQLDALRPDIRKLQLSHVNSYTTLPTIDLNNEVLENLAATVLDPAGAAIPPNYDRQTHWESAELALKVEYENAPVYAAFAGRSWPWQFPFELGHARRGIYLGAMGLSRAEILRQASLAPSTAELADAALDLNAAQRLRIDTALPLATAFEATRAQLAAVPTFMEKSQLDFQDLYAVTQLTRIYAGTTAPVMNPPVQPAASSPATWAPPVGACEPATYRLNDAASSAQPLTEAQADRMHRFVRLWRGLPWPMHLLDWAIGGFQRVAGEALFPLKWLGMAEMIRRRLKLEPRDVIAFWTPLSTRAWNMPFVRTKAVLSPLEQVFRGPVAALTLASAARSAGISVQFAEELAAGAALSEDIVSSFFRYGRLARAIPGLQPEDIKRYGDLRGQDVFASPDATWSAIQDFEAIRLSGARLAAALPLYLPPANPKARAERLQMLVAIEELNRRANLPSALLALGSPFDTQLACFAPPATVAFTVDKLSAYGTGDANELDRALAEALSLPTLLSPSLGSEANDAARKARILRELAALRWEGEISGRLARASGLDAAIARRIAGIVRTGGALVEAELGRLLGDGGTWTGWPAGGGASPPVQPRWLEEGVVTIPAAAVAAQVTVQLAGRMVVATPGRYEVRMTASYEAATGNEVVQAGAIPLLPGAATSILRFTAPEDGPAMQSLAFTLTADTACSIRMELVDPSGGVQPLGGSRVHSAAATIDRAMEALELIALSGALATQWKLGAEDLLAMVRLQSGSSGFPSFPPSGSIRPLAAADSAGFGAWLAYARIVAAWKMARGEGRRVLGETVLLAQVLGAAAPAQQLDVTAAVCSGIAEALEVEVDCVVDAARKLAILAKDFGDAGGWLELFGLARALGKHGVSADAFEAWGKTAITAAAVTSLEGAAHARLSQGRDGATKLREAVDAIRLLKRDVLALFLLARPPAGRTWRTLKEISDYVLSDIEMTPCAETSRVRFAIAAAQRLMSQAQDPPQSLLLTSEQAIEWMSISQYRPWDVRQQILVYPENWAKFGRHLHASDEFEELERTLIQGDLTEDKSREALTRYVEQLHEIGHLEIVGTCTQQEFDATGAASLDLLHVVGRTPAEPRAYYHRKRIDGAYWTPWKKIELDIDSDQVVPVVNNRQLHLFWLVVDSKAQEKPDVKKDDRQIALEDEYKTLRLAWSVLTSKGWRAKKVSRDSLPTRCGHYSANFSSVTAAAMPYAEVHAWNQAVQDIGRYQLRPALSPEGDVVIEIYAPLETTVVSKAIRGIFDFAYEIRRIVGSAWFNAMDTAAANSLNGLLNTIRAGMGTRLAFALPMAPAITPGGTRTTTAAGLRLFGKFRLTPDNLVEVRSRNTQLVDARKYLTPAERAQTLASIGTAVARSGAFEFDDGSVELHASGAYRTVLATAGTPVRVVVTRQETLPSQRDPVFCRIKNRSFFAFKSRDLLPPVRFARGVEVPQAIKNPFHPVPREYIDRAGSATASPAKATYGVALATRFAASIATSQVTTMAKEWRFELAHHPQTLELLRAVRAGLPRLYRRETQSDARESTGSLTVPFDFDANYTPVGAWVDRANLPVDELEFAAHQAYSLWNKELLCFGPLAIAEQLKRTGRHEDARNWIAFVFNPRDPAALDPASGAPPHPEKYWTFKPFEDFVASGGVGDFQNLDPNGTGDPYQRQIFRALIKQWRANPYNPHAVAAFRPQAYQLAALFLYVENLIAWGDSLFAAPSAELVEEAARRYEEAERIIGRGSPSTGAIRYDAAALTLEQLDLGIGLGGADLEDAFSVGDEASPVVEDAFLPDLAIGYFCLPPNPKVKQLRDRIQDRLFKAHHCLDLLGNPRRLPLYDPPIDPALLADAAMAGLNVSQAVMDAYTPRPHYRFRTLLGLAKGIAQQVTALGGGLLSAMEKRDAESLSILKTTHEARLLERASAVRKLQVEDAQAGTKALEATLTSVNFRQEYYASREFMNPEEAAQIALSIASTVFQVIGQALNTASSAAGAVPEISIGAAGWAGTPVAVTTTGGANFSRIPAGLGLAMGMVGEVLGTASSIAGTVGSFRRRKDEWDFQAGSAQLEAKQVDVQILGSKIRQAIAERELANHEAQLEQSREELEFVRTKQTSVRLFEWLADDIGSTYYRAFHLAHSMALQAQRALQDELGTSQRFIGFSHWDSGHGGLLAGERLLNELMEMESEFHGQNARPVVKTLSVSLAEVDPIALAELRANGTCTFKLEEAFWDRHAPGLYFRRFVSVAVSTPAVVGPFGGVHGKLSIERAEYRRDAALPAVSGGDPADSYLPQGDDGRFVTQFPRPGDYLVLSTGLRDTGLGADEAREDRYRPFENLGIASSWRLDISQKDNAFHLSTLTDVILHVEYTARDGGEVLQRAARAAIDKRASPEGVMVGLRHQFAAQWQKVSSGQVATLDLVPVLAFATERNTGAALAELEVAVLLKTKEQPDDQGEVRVNIVPPRALLDAAALDVAQLADLRAGFPLPADGGWRLGLAIQALDLSGSQDGVAFELLHAAPWSIQCDPDVGIELEDAVVIVNWKVQRVV